MKHDGQSVLQTFIRMQGQTVGHFQIDLRMFRPRRAGGDEGQGTPTGGGEDLRRGTHALRTVPMTANSLLQAHC
jgi:hypothetical protein